MKLCEGKKVLDRDPRGLIEKDIYTLVRFAAISTGNEIRTKKV